MLYSLTNEFNLFCNFLLDTFVSWISIHMFRCEASFMKMSGSYSPKRGSIIKFLGHPRAI